MSTLSFDYNNFEFLDLKRNFISSQLQITGHWPPHVFTDLRLIDFRGPTSGNEILCLSIPELAASFPKVTILSDCQSNYTTESPSTGTSISSSPVPRSSARPPTTAPPPAPPGASTLVDKILEPVIGLISAFFVAMVLLVIGVVWGLVKKLTDTVRYRVLHEINDDRQPLIVGVSPRGKARRVARRIKKGLKIKNRGKKSKIELSSTDSEVENETEVSDHREKDGDMVEKKNRADALAALEAAGMGM